MNNNVHPHARRSIHTSTNKLNQSDRNKLENMLKRFEAPKIISIQFMMLNLLILKNDQ